MHKNIKKNEDLLPGNINYGARASGKTLQDNRIHKVTQLKCKHCGAGSHNSNSCPKTKTETAKPTLTEEQLRAEAERRHARMAATHHEKTGVDGTPKERHEERRKKSIEEIYLRLKKGEEEKSGGGAACGTPDSKGPKGPPPPPPPTGGGVTA